MRRLSLVTLFSLLFISSILYIPAPGEAKEEDGLKTGVLCLPGIYFSPQDGCTPSGPSSYLTEMARKGIVLPLRPLPAVRRDPILSFVPYQYAAMKTGSAGVYPTLDDAIAGSSPAWVIGDGDLKFVSYIDMREVEGELFFQLRSGGWMRASEGISSRVSISNRFPGGLEFQHTPLNSFGWILPFSTSVETKRTPGRQENDYTGRQILQYEVVRIYSVERVGEEDWYLVNPDEWLEQRQVARVIPDATPPEGVTNGRWVEVNLAEQTLAVYDQSRLVFATLIATGIEPFWTRPGLFPIYKKLESTPMSGAFEADRSDFYYLEDVPFTMYYDEARALHGAYWRHNLGYPQSHGCVNLAIGDAHWIFQWAQEGDWVYVWDPSGKTPVDPNLYSPGGA